MTETTAALEALKETVFWDKALRRNCIVPATQGGNRSVFPGAYLRDVCDFWRDYVLDEMTAPDCNERIYHLELDSPREDGSPRRIVLMLTGIVALWRSLEIIANEEPREQGLTKARAVLRRIDDPIMRSAEIEWDETLGEGAFQRMRGALMRGELHAYELPPKKPDPERFWKKVLNPDVKGL